MNEDLKKFIDASVAAGQNAEDIRSSLLSAGWPADQVNAALPQAAAPAQVPVAPMAATAQAAAASSVGQVALYNTDGYAFTGFFFGIIPVVFMSMRNAALLPNGDALRKRMRLLLILSVAVYVALVAVAFGSAFYLTKSLSKAMATNPALALQLSYAGSANERAKVLEKAVPAAGTAQSLVSNVGNIGFLISLVLLTLAVSYANKNELPAYKEIKAGGRLKKRSPFVPILIGVAVWLTLGGGVPFVLRLVLAMK